MGSWSLGLVLARAQWWSILSSSHKMQPDQKTPGKAVSCYRSAGSLPIPTPAKLVVKKWIKLNKYKEDTEELELEDHDTFPPPTIASEHIADMTVIPVTCENIPNVMIPTPWYALTSPSRPKQQCTKHSRCHCDLLGTETEDFFRVTG
eukprot:TRINITY_DN11290_c0_g1_i2.p1 TRINITY_DN11290_c0_g1~~TRINITY_DN11290_c0_g1_i2.p1  ORF type:complete len:156 (-),score=41.36 TRINITY_DN11290_c0_g1_i2:41-484(-)